MLSFFTSIATDSTETVLKKLSDTNSIHSFSTDVLPELWKMGTGFIVSAGGKVLAAILIWFIGKWLIKYVKRTLKLVFEKRNTEPSLRSFLLSLVNTTLIIILIFTVVGVLGINTSSALALLATAGFGIGMALSGTLQNFAGGVMILLFKPYKINDYIEIQGQSGTVVEIKIFNTIINTPDNKAIHIPNGSMSSSIINNYSKEPQRRVNWDVAIAYGDNIEKAKEVLHKIMESDARILKGVASPAAPFVGLSQMADSKVNMVARAWVKSADYWDVFFDINEKIYTTMPKEGLHFPFPQMDVHVQK